jgi:5-oxoprolinase (ATP-hydrolysing)
VAYSAIIYCLRCLVNEEIPLNQGCLDPIEISIPARSILDPGPLAAVVGGAACGVTGLRRRDVLTVCICVWQATC